MHLSITHYHRSGYQISHCYSTARNTQSDNPTREAGQLQFRRYIYRSRQDENCTTFQCYLKHLFIQCSKISVKQSFLIYVKHTMPLRLQLAMGENPINNTANHKPRIGTIPFQPSEQHVHWYA
jgi:hypothetical protein